MRLTIRLKLILSFLILAFICGIMSAISIYSQSHVDDSYSDLLNRRAVILSNAKDIKSDSEQLMSSLRDFLLSQSTDSQTNLKNASNEITNLIASTLELVRVEEDKQTLQDLDQMNKQFLNESGKVFDSFQSDPQQTIQTANSEMIPLGHNMQDKADALVLGQANLMKTYSDQNSLVVDQTQHMILTISIVAIVLSVLIGLLSSQAIAKPIEQLSQTAERIANGDLTEAENTTKRKDEIGTLIVSFHQMASNLRALIQQIAANAEQVASTAEELSANTEQANHTCEQISATVQEFSVGMDMQVRNVNESFKSINDMTDRVQFIAAQSQNVSNEAVRTSVISVEGNEVVQHAIRNMNSMQASIEELAGLIHHLGEQSNVIEHIVEVIQGIAGQTNLLALNAAIEAARAGEHGKGFAVVADEVRKLAEQSSQSAQQIAELIANVQVNTQLAVEAMEKGTTEVSISIEGIAKAGHAFSTIQQSVDHVARRIQEVTASTEGMAAGSVQVVESIEMIRNIATTSAQRTEDISASSEEQLASMEEIASATEQLTEMAVQLQQMISKFKV